MNRALFLDRDGIINVDSGHLYRIEDVEFVPGIFVLCRHYQSRGYLIIIITNQAGIPKGLYSEQDFARLMEWMIQRFNDERIEIAKVYHCSHHPDFTGPCRCRKPAPGMFLDAMREHDLDMALSVNLGDKESDLEAGRRAGVKQNVLLRNNPDMTAETREICVITSLSAMKGVLQ